MKSIKYYILAVLLMGIGSLGLSYCSDDDLGPTIFPETEDTLDSTAVTYQFDKWLKQNFLDVYNLDFRYKLQDVGTNMTYELVPATLDRSIDVAVLTKYLWFDVYGKIVGSDFLKLYGPRIIALIGSPAYNPSSGSMVLGLAEGGVKVSLFRINEINVNDFESLNEYCFKTMHHEFSHILHQTKTYPSVFNTLSVGHYDGTNWASRQEGEVATLGFVTPYASSAYREDFAETIANYIVKTDADWNRILDIASRGWATDAAEGALTANYYCYYYYKDNVVGEENKTYIDERNVDSTYLAPNGDTLRVQLSNGRVVLSKDYFMTTNFKQQSDGTYADANGHKTDAQGYYIDERGNRILMPIIVYNVPDTDGIDGRAVILRKVDIARQWLKDDWGVDLDALRAEVQYRQTHYDINQLRQEVFNTK